MFQQMMYPQMINTQGIQYVNGMKSAQAYQMGANQEVILMDQNNPVFYLKSTDAAGMASIREFEFTEKIHEDPTKADIEDIKQRMQKIEFMIQSMKEAENESVIRTETAQSTVAV